MEREEEKKPVGGGSWENLKNAFLSLQELNIGRKTSKAIKISGWLARVGLIYCTYSVVDVAGVKVWSALPSGPDWTRSWWAFHRDPGPCHLEKPKSVFMPHRSTASSRQVSNGLQLQKVPVMCLGCLFFSLCGKFPFDKDGESLGQQQCLGTLWRSNNMWFQILESRKLPRR